VSDALWATLHRGIRRAALPLASYYAVTLGVPLANGAAPSNPAFVKHAMTVVVAPPIAIVLACAVHATVRSLIVIVGPIRNRRGEFAGAARIEPRIEGNSIAEGPHSTGFRC